MAGDLASLLVLRVQGIASVDRAGIALGVDEAVARSRLDSLVAAELAKERVGRLAGFTLSPAGLEFVEKLLAEEGLRGSTDLRDCYERFLTIDPIVKKVCSRSQIEGADAALDELLALHDKARVCLRRIIKAAPRYSPYLARLDACVARLEEGDADAFTKPLSESYHQVWWELHQDLLLTLGLEREE